jgi:regulatory protein
MRVRKTRNPGSAEAARYRALRLLERRPQGTAELARKLRQRGFEEGVVAAVLARLTAAGLLDDPAYAARLAASRLRAKPQGKRLLAAALSARGLDRRLADQAAAGALAGTDEAALAAEAARRYLARKRKGTPEETRRRLAAFLARRGFDASAARRALTRLGGTDDLE